jgi:hypothetical protein
MAKQKEQKPINLPSGIEVSGVRDKLKHEKKIAVKYQKRRHSAWNEIYELYRNIVRINRLTQRQRINIPLMKETIRSVGAKINETTDIELKSKSGSLDKEIIINTIWDTAAEDNSFILLDRVDKKQENLYGRSHFVLNIDRDANIPVTIDVKDIYELLVDPQTKPWDIETARFTVETDIYKPLDIIKKDKSYDKDARAKVAEQYTGTGSSGMKKSAEYKDSMQAKKERLQALGIDNLEDLEGYDKIVSLNGHITTLYDKDLKKEVRYYVLMANDEVILKAKPLKDVIGVDFYPYEGWADDLEITDYWSDGIGDLILTPNKTINTWISQYMENRTLRSFGMNFYNSKVEGFNPQSWQPRPFGWYPLPGKPDDVFKRVDIPEITGTLEDIQFIVNIAEKASATGAIDKGAVEDVKRTLGEIEIAVGNAMQRTNDMAPYYKRARQRIIWKWYEMLNANVGENQKIKLYKKALDGTLTKREVTKEEWADEEGYEVEVGIGSQILVEKTDEIVRMKAVAAEFPNNMPLRKAIQKRMIGIINLTPQERQEIEDYEIQQAEARVNDAAAIPVGAEAAAGQLEELARVGGKPEAPAPIGGGVA